MVSVSEIIKTFKMCYNSFEICSVIHYDGNIWQNVLTSFYLSKETLDIPQENVVFDGVNIKILNIQMNILKLFDYLEWLIKGQIPIRGNVVHFEDPFDYDNLKIQEDSYARYRQTEGARTFVCQRSLNVFNNNRLLTDHLDQINGEVIKLGFIDAFDFISHHTGVRHYTSSSSYDFLVIIPIFFSINSAKVENGTLNVDLIYDNEFRDLQINVIGYSDFSTKIYREYMEVNDKKRANFILENMLPESRFEIFLFSRSLPELQLEETVIMPIIQPLLPFTQTYNQFHKLEELEIILTKPETLDSKQRSDLFEKAVCDLLSLCGLSTIHLGDHEILRLDKKTNIGSADILTYDGLENIFVIDCDIRFPDPKKMENLIHLCRYLKSVPKVNEVKNVIPIIVSPNPTSLDNSEVLIIDGEIIQRLIKGIYYKSKKELVSIITERYFQLQRANQRLIWR